MKGFVLPSLQPSAKGSVWCSQVTLPPPPTDIIMPDSRFVLPPIDRGRRRSDLKRMEARTAALKAEALREHLMCLERRIRGAICDREHERRYQMIWQYQKEKARVERETAAIEAKAMALQRSRYMRGMRDYKTRGHVLHLETTARLRLLTEEENAWRYIMSLLELVSLKDRHRQAEHEAVTAECLAQDLRDIRDWESRIARMSFYPTKPFSPATQIFSSRNVGTGGYRGRDDLLMDYTVCEEEWSRRVEIMADERVARLPLEWRHSATLLECVEEPRARMDLEKMYLYGSCQTRLSALLRIQRWWRMLRATPWRERKRQELKMLMRDKRKQRTSRDYHDVLKRLKRQLGSVSSTPMSLEEVRSAMAAVERAAELSHQNLFDYFVYTLMNRAKNLQETEAQRLRAYPLKKDDGTSSTPQVSALLRVPHRLYVRQQPLQPYPLWRACRWLEGSTSFLLQVRLQEEAETQARGVLLLQEKNNFDTLQLYGTTLKNGAWAWRSLYTAVLCIEGDETIGRGLVQVSEESERELIAVEMDASLSRCNAVVECLGRMMADEEEIRLALIAKERSEYDSLTGGEWRWDNLLRLRQKLQSFRDDKTPSRMDGDFVSGEKYVSLDTTARVIQRFLRVARFRVRCARRRAAQAKAARHEEELKTSLAQLMGLLETQHVERKREDVVAAAGVLGDFLFEERAGTSEEAAVRAFWAWFNERAREPMEPQYETVVARFRQSHRELYRRMHILFAAARDGREQIERQAGEEFNLLRRADACVAIELHALCVREAEERQRLEADVSAERSRCCERHQVLAALAECTAVKRESEKGRGTKHVPQMSHMERLVSREEMIRTRVLLEERRGRGAVLLSLHATLRDAVMQEEEEERVAVHDEINTRWYALSPHTLLIREEELARCDVENAMYKNYGALLERECVMYARHTLLRRFFCERLSFDSEARYFDRELTNLLLQRVSFVDTKLNELVDAETWARMRLMSLEETCRRVYFGFCDVD